MKIDIRQIPQAGSELRETCDAAELNLDSRDIKFKSPVMVEVKVARISNVVTVDVNLNAEAECICSRCREAFKNKKAKKKSFNYPVSNDKPIFDITEDIRQEIILDYPIKILCKQDCKGLCPKCGKNLNLGPCNCQMRPELTERKRM